MIYMPSFSPNAVLRVALLISSLALAISCSREPSHPRPAGVNLVESVSSQQVMHNGEPWVEVTILQRVDPRAPAYVLGIRDSKWANRLGWALVEQKIGVDTVTSRFRFKPIGEGKEIQLGKDDFEWFPQVLPFEPIKVVLNSEHTGISTNGNKSFRSETNRTSSAGDSPK